jgi:hypothetical protein
MRSSDETESSKLDQNAAYKKFPAVGGEFRVKY